MFLLFRCGIPAVAFVAAFTLIPDVTCAQEQDVRDGAGIVWFVGTVHKPPGEQAVIDLGDAHGLFEGDNVAVFRAHDDHFRPLGTIHISQSLPVSSIPQTTIKFDLETGDRVVYMRTLSQLGTGKAFAENFVKQQIVKTGRRNRYSTFMQLEEADVLERYLLRQPRWQRDQEHIAGTIRSASFSRNDLDEMRPLLKQVLKFHDFQTAGVPIEQTVGAAWKSVLTTLTPAMIEEFDSIEHTLDAAEPKQLPVGGKQAADPEEYRKKVIAIRRQVDELLFLRPPEQRNVVTIICAALEVLQPRNERQWYSLQLRSTQFAALSGEKQLLDEFELVMKRIRAEK